MYSNGIEFYVTDASCNDDLYSDGILFKNISRHCWIINVFLCLDLL